jgi:LacI family transcriptional regulator
VSRQPESSATATIYSVAERAGVSIATVSRVLRGTDTASATATQKVLEAAQSLNYVPQNSARSLATRRYSAHAMVIGAMTGPYYSELIMGYEAAAARHGQSVVLVVADAQQDPLTDVRNVRGRVDGVLMAHFAVASEAIQRLGQTMPVVVVGRDEVPGCDLISSENLTSATDLTAHLLSHGRRKLLFAGDPDGSTDVRDRYRGFVEAHRALGLRARAAGVRVPQTEDGGAAAVSRIFKRRKDIDGLVCANDELALSLMTGLQRRGVSFPDDMVAVGWDDVNAARYVAPGLTTVRQPVREMGALAAEVLHRRVAGTPPGPPQILPTTVVLRASCGCPTD